MINDDIKGTYEAVQYKSYAYEQSSIDRLCATARVYGLKATLPENSKVLEIGCASGGNLISQAINYPNARFFGIDLSSAQIQIGQKALEKTGLKNVKLLAMDATKACEELKGQEFDYIICHGVFSWVPDFVKKAILEIGANLLSANGVMMISYNVFPGWKYKEPTRDFMRFASRNFDYEKEPKNKLDLALASISFEKAVYRTTPIGNNAYQKLIRELKTEIGTGVENMKSNSSYLLHEYLEIFNSPSYLCDFVADASDLGLAYIEDISLHFDISELANSTLIDFANTYFSDRISKDQMFDFLYSTQFRHSLLTKNSNENSLVFDYAKIDDNLDDLYIGLCYEFAHLKEQTKGLPMEALANALVDAYPGTISAKEAKKLVTQGSLAEHIFDINSSLNGGVYFSTQKLQKIPYKVGKSRLRQNYKNYIKFLQSDKDEMFALASPLNRSIGATKNDLEVLAMLDGKNSQNDIVMGFLELCRKTGNVPNVTKDGKTISITNAAEQQIYFKEVIEKIIKTLENDLMFEKI